LRVVFSTRLTLLEFWRPMFMFSMTRLGQSLTLPHYMSFSVHVWNVP
jgi:hypothetical protein